MRTILFLANSDKRFSVLNCRIVGKPEIGRLLQAGLATSLTQGQITAGKIVSAQASQKQETNGAGSLELRNATISDATLTNVTVGGIQPSGVVILSNSGCGTQKFHPAPI